MTERTLGRIAAVALVSFAPVTTERLLARRQNGFRLAEVVAELGSPPAAATSTALPRR